MLFELKLEKADVALAFEMGYWLVDELRGNEVTVVKLLTPKDELEV